jgi:hypothetical protein
VDRVWIGIPGFVGYYFLDSGKGTVSSVTIREDQAGSEASTARARDWVQERLSSLIESGPEIMTGQIIVDHARVDATTWPRRADLEPVCRATGAGSARPVLI